jgi:peroxiredoxin
MRHWLPLLIACAAASLGCSSGSPPRASLAASAVPATPLTTLDGKATDLPTFLHARPAVVALWATWCDSCADETIALNRLERQAERNDAVVVGVAVGDSAGTVNAFARNHHVEYPLLLDPDFRIADSLGEKRVPTTLVVDRSAHIVFRGGALDRDGLAAFRDVLARR